MANDDHRPGAGSRNPQPDSPQGAPGQDPAERAPAGPDEDARKTVAPAGSGATSWEDAETEVEAAREAGEYAASVAADAGIDVDPEAAAPIPADDREALATPGTGSSAPADSEPNQLDETNLSTG